MLKVQYDSETGAVVNAFDGSIEVEGAFISVAESDWNNLIGVPLKVVDGALTADMTGAKAKACNTLWKNYKAFQTKYVDAEDLTLASLCASGGSAKGKAVQAWVMGLWQTYYAVKDQLEAVQDLEGLNAIELTADGYGTPPYTIRELNVEASAVMNPGAENDNGNTESTEGK